MQHVVLTILLLAAGGYKLVEYYGYTNTFFASYFEDLIALPLILLLAQTGIRVLSERWRSFRISARDVLRVTLLFAVYFEGALPYFDKRFTADPVDVICYAFGALVFLLINRYEQRLTMNKLLT